MAFGFCTRSFEYGLFLHAFGEVKDGFFVDVRPGGRLPDELLSELRRREWNGIETDSPAALTGKIASLSLGGEAAGIHLLRAEGSSEALASVDALAPWRPWMVWVNAAPDADQQWRERRYDYFHVEGDRRCYLADERRGAGGERGALAMALRQEEVVQRLLVAREALVEENARLTIELARLRVEFGKMRHYLVVRRHRWAVVLRLRAWLWNLRIVRKTYHFFTPTARRLRRIVLTAWADRKRKASPSL